MHRDKQGKICTAGFLRGISPRERRSAGTRRCDAITIPECESRDPLSKRAARLHNTACKGASFYENRFRHCSRGDGDRCARRAIADAPGLWEVTMQMQMPNMPAAAQIPEMKLPPQCVTPERRRTRSTPCRRGPQGRGARKDDCKVGDYKMSGNKAAWTMTCTTPDTLTSTGEMTFADDSYTGAMKMVTAQGEMTMKVSGKRVGDCKP
jgi:hypothetical protein